MKSEKVSFLRKYSIFLLILSLPLFSFSQDSTDTRKEWKEKIFFGGNLGLQFGVITQVDVSPIVGYRYNENITNGVRLTFQYFKNRRTDLSKMIYGGGVFTRYVIFKGIYAHVEYEPLNVDQYNVDKRKWIHGLLVGGGYRHSLGKNGYMHFELLYNLNHTLATPYKNPLIRVGVSF